MIASQLTYGAVNYMDSVTFCGQTCHTVMQPEYTAYQNSPHSRVECVKCHIGPGAGWFVKSKLSGVGQVFAVTFNTYPRPIPTPVHNLRPARETCETCHWPQKYGEDRVQVINKFADDETNTHHQDRAADEDRRRQSRGRHSRHAPRAPGDVVIRYGHSDEARQNIPWVEYNGQRQEDACTPRRTPSPTAAACTMREMDCMDCHNRPSHSLRPAGPRRWTKPWPTGLISAGAAVRQEEGRWRS